MAAIALPQVRAADGTAVGFPFQLLFTLSSFLLLALSGEGIFVSARADSEAAEQLGAVVVRVRAVKATEEENAETSRSAPNVDNRLDDIKRKLCKLQFHNFKMISSQETEVPIKRKQTLSLLNGQTLTLRPLYVEGDRVGLWLKWQDNSGMQILDTRMHLDSGESMLTGIDGSSDSGLILAIDVHPKP